LIKIESNTALGKDHAHFDEEMLEVTLDVMTALC
jgi:hypothetical protein